MQFYHCHSLTTMENFPLLITKFSDAPSRLADLCCFARDNGLEPKEMCFVSPNLRKAPNIVLIHYVKGGGRQLRFLDPLYVYNEDGTYTESLRECYK